MYLPAHKKTFQILIVKLRLKKQGVKFEFLISVGLLPAACHELQVFSTYQTNKKDGFCIQTLCLKLTISDHIYCTARVLLIQLSARHQASIFFPILSNYSFNTYHLSRTNICKTAAMPSSQRVFKILPKKTAELEGTLE